MKNKILTIFLLLSLVFIARDSFAGQRLSLLSEGKYFTVYGDESVNPDYIVAKLDYNYFSYPDNILSEGRARSDALGSTMDAIYSEVSDILDLHSYNYHGQIKILSNQGDISNAFQRFFGRSFQERSFYLKEENTIFISAPDITLGMLAHEMAHAIICHYFVVPPPAKTQEVLAGYVEYTLRKKAGSLPSNLAR